MFWESDRDENMIAEMYGTTRLYVSRPDIPDIDAEDKSLVGEDYFGNTSVPQTQQPIKIGDTFSSLEAMDQQFLADDSRPELASNVTDVSLAVPPAVSRPAPQKHEALPPRVANVPNALTMLDEPSQVAMRGEVVDASIVPPRESRLPKIRVDGNVVDGSGDGAERQSAVGPSTQNTASPYHALRGNFGGKPLSHGGIPDARFTGQLSDGNALGDASGQVESALAMYLNNLTQLQMTQAAMLLDHAERIRDVEETIERSC